MPNQFGPTFIDGVVGQLNTGASTTYVPAVTQSGAVTAGSFYAHYFRIGNIVFVWSDFVITGAGSAGSLVTVTLPVTAVSATHPTGPIGTGIIFDSSLTTDYPCNVLLNDDVSIKFRESDITTSSSWGVVPNVGLANNDTIRFFCVYESQA